jgi:LytS/YehU family sensor histidine kinase
MNPHFIFNSLNSINYFISREDKLSANNYIADFSRLIRSILTNLSSDYIKFEMEMESLHDYLKLEHLRFSEKFNYTIEDEKVENSCDLIIFPGMIQPFVENAIWHGVRGIENRKGYIRISFIQISPVKMQCIIEDDGIGRKLSQQYYNPETRRKSRGIGIVMERLKLINALSKVKYLVTIEDLFNDKIETGTKVTIELPIKQTAE